MSYEIDFNNEELIHDLNEINKSIDQLVLKYDNKVKKDEILKLIGENGILTCKESHKYSIIRISTVDRVDSLKKYRELIQNTLELEFEGGTIREYSVYKDRVWISFHSDVVQFWLMGDKNDNVLMTEVKDKIINVLVAEYNSHKICLHTKLLNGYQNWEFFKCDKYEEPKETWITKIVKILGG